MNELLLWRWSTTVQITSALTIAIFFLVLGRSIRRVELRPWVQAWLANLGALAVTSVFWLAQPQSEAVFIGLRAGYLFTKTSFVLLLALGVWTFVRSTPPARIARIAFACVGVYAIGGAFMLTDIQRIGVGQSSVMALFFLGSATALVVRQVPGSGWLAVGFCIRGVLAVVEATAYATRAFATSWSSDERIGIFIASHSSFDTGAEWVIALGCVLTLYRAIQRELTQSNGDLLAAQEVLQELVDRDSLTGLSNRRALPALLRESFKEGATVLFFDLNDFKEINDSYGHQAGDECLKRFARALQACFRPEDAVIRYAGDEFVVIARADTPGEIQQRIDTLRDRLKLERNAGPPIRFSVGQAHLPVNGVPEEALRAADEAMYRDKATKPRTLRSA
jgi:diguanylate cyclase (GGDEF)-like protein